MRTRKPENNSPRTSERGVRFLLAEIVLLAGLIAALYVLAVSALGLEVVP